MTPAARNSPCRPGSPAAGSMPPHGNGSERARRAEARKGPARLVLETRVPRRPLAKGQAAVRTDGGLWWFL